MESALTPSDAAPKRFLTKYGPANGGGFARSAAVRVDRAVGATGRPIACAASLENHLSSASARVFGRAPTHGSRRNSQVEATNTSGLLIGIRL